MYLELKPAAAEDASAGAYSARGVAASSSGGKFWTVSVHDNRLETTWGKLGATPTAKSWHVADAATALAEAIKRTESKRKAGYEIEVESEASAGSKAAAIPPAKKKKKTEAPSPAAKPAAKKKKEAGAAAEGEGKVKPSAERPLEGLSVCVSGQMSMVRKTFYQMLSQHGANISTAVTGSTTVLVTTACEAQNPTHKVHATVQLPFAAYAVLMIRCLCCADHSLPVLLPPLAACAVLINRCIHVLVINVLWHARSCRLCPNTSLWWQSSGCSTRSPTA